MTCRLTPEDYRTKLLQCLKVSFQYGATFEQLVSVSMEMLGKDCEHIAEYCNGALFDLQQSGLVVLVYREYADRVLYLPVLNPMEENLTDSGVLIKRL